MQIPGLWNYLSRAGERIVAMALSEVFTCTPIVLYPVQLGMELRIEDNQMTSTSNHFLDLVSGCSKICLTGKYASCAARLFLAVVAW